MTTLSDRFWSKVRIEGECWVWLGAQARCAGRVPMLWVVDRMIRARWVAYEIVHGAKPVATRLVPTCTTTLCVNPHHMDLSQVSGFAAPSLAPSVFWASVAKDDGCWEWQLGRTILGYGVARGHFSRQFAHRVAWELTNGPIPKGLGVLHRCDNPPCVRPDHLFVGTQADNCRDMSEKGRSLRGRPGVLRGVTVGTAKLTDADVVEIRALRAKGVQQRAVAARFGVSQPTVQRIEHGKTWRHVPEPAAVQP